VRVEIRGLTKRFGDVLALSNLGAPVGELVGALARIRGIPVARVEKLGARLDLDLPSLAGRPFRGLSGGMKQKLLVALALASEPALLILDEPTGSLDARSRERFFGLFEELADDVTVILCSHRLEEVQQLVDHVLVLEEGRLVYDGHASGFLEMNSGGGDGDGPA
jgi:ABC-2 type transport system ATP-binding protein